MLVAVVTDLRSQKIHNALTFPAILFGLAWHSIFFGWDGFVFAISGFGLGLALMFLPFAMGIMGAGDVKLMAAAGAFLGTEIVFQAFLYTCIVGGIYSLTVMLFDPKMLKSVMIGFWRALNIFIASKQFSYAPVNSGKKLPKLCYGVAIAGGTAITVFSEYATELSRVWT